MDKQQIIDYIRHTPNNSNVNVVKGMLNSEGGGSSDFSTANVTLVISGGETGITLPAIRALDPPIEGLDEVLVSTYYVSENSGTYEIALYNGATVLFQYNQYFADNVSVSGNAIYDPNYPDTPAIIISGDCTITLS